MHKAVGPVPSRTTLDVAGSLVPAHGLLMTSTGDAFVTLVWNPVTVPDLFRFRNLPSASPGGPYDAVGTSLEPCFTDASIADARLKLRVV